MIPRQLAWMSALLTVAMIGPAFAQQPKPDPSQVSYYPPSSNGTNGYGPGYGYQPQYFQPAPFFGGRNC